MNIQELLLRREIEMKNAKKSTSERGELISFFVEILRDKDGKQFPARRIAVALAHLKLSDLYYMKSSFKEVEGRLGFVGASKWFWWSLKVKK
jgi:hypothetical protein